MLSAAMTATRSGSALVSSRAASSHLLVEVVGELADVLRVEVAPHGVTLAVDVDVDDAAFHRRAVRG